MAQPPPSGAFPPLQPGQQPTPEQIRQMQAQITAEAQKAGMSVPDYVNRLKQQALQQHQLRQQQQQQQLMQPQGQGRPAAPGATQPGQQVPINPGPPKPEALAVANFLRGQNLKTRTCIFQEKRKEMFKVKRAIRALHSPAYEKARRKNALLPAVTDRASAENTFKMLPISLLALRVSKVDPHDGHNHAKKKRVKGLWTVQVVPQQDTRDELHYVWLYEGSQWKNKLYAGGALALILAVVFFPIWPYHLRLGVWYVSMGMLGLLGLFFAMAIFRLILFLATMFLKPPGLWLFPNLFEDVGFFDSFKPTWGWHEDEKAMKKRKKDERERKRAKREGKTTGDNPAGNEAASVLIAPPTAVAEQQQQQPQPPSAKPTDASATGFQNAPAEGQGSAQQRNLSARVEEVEDD